MPKRVMGIVYCDDSTCEGHRIQTNTIFRQNRKPGLLPCTMCRTRKCVRKLTIHRTHNRIICEECIANRDVTDGSI